MSDDDEEEEGLGAACRGVGPPDNEVLHEGSQSVQSAIESVMEEGHWGIAWCILSTTMTTTMSTVEKMSQVRVSTCILSFLWQQDRGCFTKTKIDFKLDLLWQAVHATVCSHHVLALVSQGMYESWSLILQNLPFW